MTVYARPGAEGSVMTYPARYDNFIGGEWVAPAAGRYFENRTPVTGEVFIEIARSDESDIEKALDAASPALLAPLPEDKQILRHPGFNHMEDFIHSVQTRKPPIAPLEEGHVSNIACILTHAAFKTGKPLAWDAAAQTILNNAEAAELTAYKPRKEYSIHTLLQSV